MVRIWAEWDIGNEDLVFSSEEKAREWLGKNTHVREIIENHDDWATVQDIIEEGLIGFRDLIVDPVWGVDA